MSKIVTCGGDIVFINNDNNTVIKQNDNKDISIKKISNNSKKIIGFQSVLENCGHGVTFKPIYEKDYKNVQEQ